MARASTGRLVAWIAPTSTAEEVNEIISHCAATVCIQLPTFEVRCRHPPTTEGRVAKWAPTGLGPSAGAPSVRGRDAHRRANSTRATVTAGILTREVRALVLSDTQFGAWTGDDILSAPDTMAVAEGTPL